MVPSPFPVVPAFPQRGARLCVGSRGSSCAHSLPDGASLVLHKAPFVRDTLDPRLADTTPIITFLLAGCGATTVPCDHLPQFLGQGLCEDTPTPFHRDLADTFSLQDAAPAPSLPASWSHSCVCGGEGATLALGRDPKSEDPNRLNAYTTPPLEWQDDSQDTRGSVSGLGPQPGLWHLTSTGAMWATKDLCDERACYAAGGGSGQGGLVSNYQERPCGLPNKAGKKVGMRLGAGGWARSPSADSRGLCQPLARS